MRFILLNIFDYLLHNMLNIIYIILKVRLEQYSDCIVVVVYQLSHQPTQNRGTRSDQRRSVWYVSLSIVWLPRGVPKLM